jgi:tRNA(fMet)-specific endonuclease VapC
MILDTDFLVDVMKGNADAVGRQQLIGKWKEEYKVSAATIFELLVGIALSKKSAGEKSKVESVLANFNTVALSRQVAEKAGEIHGSLLASGQPIGALDSMIAASAVMSNEPLLTGNVKHFSRVKGLRVESY